MAERPDLREIASSLREAIGGLERDALVDVLTYVLNEYVVEGPPPLAPAQVERLEDLAGLNLAQLVSALQTRLETPGLELFRVEPGSEEVRVQTASGWVALQPGRAASAATAPAATAPAATAPAATAPASPAAIEGRAGARFVEQPMRAPAERSAPPASTGRAAADEALARGRGDLVGGERGPAAPTAPRPRGLSVSGRPAGGGATQWNPPQAQPTPRPPAGTANSAGAAGQPAPQGQPPPNQPDPAAQPGDKPTRDEDDASIRFSLLELD